MLGLLVLLVLIEQGVMTSGFFHSDGDSLGRRRRSMLEDDPCLDSRKVDNVESVEFLPRYAGLKRPWLRSDIKPKVDDVLRFLDGQNCTFLAIGDVVWKSLQMARPVKIDGEISCPVEKVRSIAFKLLRSTLFCMRLEQIIMTAGIQYRFE
ncbi:unnamed protein product [Heligmosomoides polygyrus]|uniref:Secreted protein n=1 Tax=Heligmosomoides polygyrus TaxID=6339 RepID=A0A183F3G9_HELPZ|nr:unnamed protein product [Heligmosomoides polygyrus]